MNLLHLCSYYIGNKLYQKLFSRLADSKDFYQEVYIPIKDKKLEDKNSFENEKIKFYYDSILLKKDRLMYKSKVKKQLNKIERLRIDLANINIIHAHTVFSDGGTAYLLKRKYGIKYVVSVRNTDINAFYKYFIHQRKFMYKVLLNAEIVICVSEAYKRKVLKIIPNNMLDEISSKLIVMPNGIDEDWFEKNSKNKPDSSIKRLMFTGSLDDNKNLITVLKVLKQLNDSQENYTLEVAGEGPEEKKLQDFVNKNKLSNNVYFHGHLYKNELQELMKTVDIFILPSIHETFGISYIEAMSKGVPVLYTENEGIDGFFKQGQVGYSVQPLNVEDIVEKVGRIYKNYSATSEQCLLQSHNFSWDKIADKYVELYNKIRK